MSMKTSVTVWETNNLTNPPCSMKKKLNSILAIIFDRKKVTITTKKKIVALIQPDLI